MMMMTIRYVAMIQWQNVYLVVSSFSRKTLFSFHTFWECYHPQYSWCSWFLILFARSLACLHLIFLFLICLLCVCVCLFFYCHVDLCLVLLQKFVFFSWGVKRMMIQMKWFVSVKKSSKRNTHTDTDTYTYQSVTSHFIHAFAQNGIFLIAMAIYIISDVEMSNIILLYILCHFIALLIMSDCQMDSTYTWVCCWSSFNLRLFYFGYPKCRRKWFVQRTLLIILKLTLWLDFRFILVRYIVLCLFCCTKNVIVIYTWKTVLRCRNANLSIFVPLYLYIRRSCCFFSLITFMIFFQKNQLAAVLSINHQIWYRFHT